MKETTSAGQAERSLTELDIAGQIKDLETRAQQEQTRAKELYDLAAGAEEEALLATIAANRLRREHKIRPPTTGQSRGLI
jgi:hypothetical protein